LAQGVVLTTYHIRDCGLPALVFIQPDMQLETAEIVCWVVLNYA